jgi:membrane-associated phospholipid phosphatase
VDVIGTLERPAVAAPALPTTLRGPAVALAGLAAVVLAVVGWLVAGTTSANAVDLWAERLIAAHHSLRGALPQLAVVVGEPVTVVVCAALLAGWCLYRRRPALAAVAVLGPGFTGLAETVIKPIVGRTLSGGAGVDLAFPSGHTAGATALGLAVAVVVAGLVREHRELWLLALTAATFSGAAIVAVGLVDERAHYPTDTLGGLCLAVVTTVLTAVAVDAVAARRNRRRQNPVTQSRASSRGRGRGGWRCR